MDNYRILANPCLLADEKVVNIKVSFNDKLKDLISHEYCELYIPDNTYDKINQSIKTHINELVIDQTINDILNTIIETVISDHEDKKFDFCLPFD